MLFIAHQLGHKVSVQATSAYTPGAPMRTNYVHRRKRYNSAFTFFRLLPVWRFA